jgi:hypothetical protein
VSPRGSGEDSIESKNKLWLLMGVSNLEELDRLAD